MKNLCFIMGDQLSIDLPSLKKTDPKRDVIFMCEVMDEITYVKHHPQKIILVLSAMRHFAEALRDKGYTVDYVQVDDPNNTGNFVDEFKRAIARHSPNELFITTPSEYRVREMLKDYRLMEDTRFFATPTQFSEWASNRKQLRMEYFYRELRKQTGILMTKQGKPVGGEWNYDTKNRHRFDQTVDIPALKTFKPDAVTQAVIDWVTTHCQSHFGKPTPFRFAVTRRDALNALNHFIKTALPYFGYYQDAMVTDEPYLFHAHISMYLNIGLLSPKEVCEKAEKAYQDKKAPIEAVEGFIRQILGWREYIRGFYWHFMPALADDNFLDAHNPLPEFYWTGETDMHCLKQAITATRDNAYAHHIQRLMITGNYALLTGVDPKALCEWYLIVYADAFDWVELPNTLAMVAYADGGKLASKPYCASGNYINKMSDYCKQCKYNVKQREGEQACPFNQLYWDFLARHRDKLEGNPRMGLVYKVL